jgi:hypothetical protein
MAKIDWVGIGVGYYIGPITAAASCFRACGWIDIYLQVRAKSELRPAVLATGLHKGEQRGICCVEALQNSVTGVCTPLEYFMGACPGGISPF